MRYEVKPAFRAVMKRGAPQGASSRTSAPVQLRLLLTHEAQEGRTPLRLPEGQAAAIRRRVHPVTERGAPEKYPKPRRSRGEPPQTAAKATFWGVEV